jgi:outer membrane protein assembly factor BamB
MKRLMTVLVLSSLLGGCGALRGGGGPRTPTVGERTPVLNAEAPVLVDESLASVPVTLPAPIVNPAWAQSGGNAAKAMIHVALSATPVRQWSVSIGSGSGPRARLAAEPVIGDGRIYTIDTGANVRAFDANTGSQIWQTQVRGEQASGDTLFGGGVSFDNGRVYVTNGAGYAAALDATNGQQVWITRPGGPLRGSPSVTASHVYVLSQDNQMFALNTATGALEWSGTGAVEAAGIFGTSSPAFAQSTVVAGFSSGELTAYRYENGQVVWQDALARTGVSTIVGNLSDIDADPVIHNGRVFAVGQGGRMVAVELITGQRVWELNIAGISTPWVAGDWVFVMTDRAQLLAVARSSGRVRWISQLDRYQRPERRSEPDPRTGQVSIRPGQGPIFWRGPVLAGGQLVLTSSTGQIAYINPADGSIIRTETTTDRFSLPPIVANNIMYTLSDAGQLTAWR